MIVARGIHNTYYDEHPIWEGNHEKGEIKSNCGQYCLHKGIRVTM